MKTFWCAASRTFYCSFRLFPFVFTPQRSLAECDDTLEHCFSLLRCSDSNNNNNKHQSSGIITIIMIHERKRLEQFSCLIDGRRFDFIFRGSLHDDHCSDEYKRIFFLFYYVFVFYLSKLRIFWLYVWGMACVRAPIICAHVWNAPARTIWFGTRFSMLHMNIDSRYRNRNCFNTLLLIPTNHLFCCFAQRNFSRSNLDINAIIGLMHDYSNRYVVVVVVFVLFNSKASERVVIVVFLQTLQLSARVIIYCCSIKWYKHSSFRPPKPFIHTIYTYTAVDWFAFACSK